MESKNSVKDDKKIILSKVLESSTPYLKKSELPTNVSGFKNDAGYLTSTTLEKWLNTHSYIKLSDIETVIKESNLDINKENLNSIRSNINGIKGEIDEIKTHLKDNIMEIVDRGYVSMEMVSDFATKRDIEKLDNRISKIKNIDPSKFAKASDVYNKDVIDIKLDEFIKKQEVKDTYLPKKDIEGTYITKKDANNKFLTIEDYRGLKAGAIISDAYKNSTFNDIDRKIDSGVIFLDGFYIIDGGNSFVFIRNNEVISTSGGSGSGQLIWRKDTGKDYIQHS